MRNVVLDLETMGTRPDSAVMSIGAVCIETGEEFYKVITNPSGYCDPETARWWMRQADAVREAVCVVGESEGLVTLLFRRWLDDLRDADPDNRDLRIWGTEGFDTTVLDSLYGRVGTHPPWMYYEVRGLETAFELLGVDKNVVPWAGTQHIAIECARHAADALKAALLISKYQNASS